MMMGGCVVDVGVVWVMVGRCGGGVGLGGEGGGEHGICCRISVGLRVAFVCFCCSDIH